MAADQDASQLATAFISVICPKLLHKLLHSKHRVSCHGGGKDVKPEQRAVGCFGLLSKTQLGSHVVCCTTEYLGATTQSRAESTTCNSISISPKSSKGHFGLAIRRPCLWPKAPLPLLAVQNNYNSLVNRTVRTLSLPLSLFLSKKRQKQEKRQGVAGKCYFMSCPRWERGVV